MAGLNHHIKYAMTVGHPTPPTLLNSLLKAISFILICLFLMKLVQDYRTSTGLTLEEAKLMMQRPHAVLLVTDISAIQYQSMPENDDQERADEHYGLLCRRLELAFSRFKTVDFECYTFAEALSIPVAKFEQETFRNPHEMVRLREAKITSTVFEDAVASFFTNALNNYIRHLKVSRQKWSLFNRDVMDVDAISKKPLVLINSDGFVLRFARGLLAKQPPQSPFLNFLVIHDNFQPPTSFDNSTTKSNTTLSVQKRVLRECRTISSCHIVSLDQLTGDQLHSVLMQIYDNLTIAHPGDLSLD